MLNFKSCPRCDGDVHGTSDWYGEYLTCLQCGWYKDASDEPIPGSLKLSLEEFRVELPALTRAS